MNILKALNAFSGAEQAQKPQPPAEQPPAEQPTPPEGEPQPGRTNLMAQAILAHEAHMNRIGRKI